MFGSFYSGKKILITGGLGFLGSTLAHRLTALGSEVTIIDSLMPLYGGNIFNIEGINERITVVIADVRKAEVMASLIPDKDIIFHFAAQVSYIDSLSMPYDDLDLNARSTLQILEVCRQQNKTAKIIFSSSRMVVGKVIGQKMTEDVPTNPLSLYGIHKLASEKYLQMYYNDFGIPCVILRIANPYGPRQQIKHSKYSLVGWFIRLAMEGKIIKIFGDGAQVRDYIYVDDIVEAFLSCGLADKVIGEVVNVGSGTETAFREMVEQVVLAVPGGSFEFVSWPSNYERVETGDVRTDISKLTGLTGWKPKVQLAEGIRKTHEYYLTNFRHYVGTE